jgi:von Willebrand factor type A C-terminal domain/von Willebrand factor type A domain
MKFSLQPFCNAFLEEGNRRVDVIMTVHAVETDSSAANRGPLEFGIVIDCSGSMSQHGKMAAAKLAARSAIARIPDGVIFFVICFNSEAYLVVPATVSTAAARAAASARVSSIEASGGTSMASGLDAANAQFGTAPDTIRVCQFYTDGDNGDQAGVLEDCLEELRGRFQCECRGIGDDWKPPQLLQIAQALLGTAKLVAGGDDIAADLKSTFEAAAARRAAGVKLRLIVPPKTASIVKVQQVSPTIIDLTSQRVAVDDRTFDFPTGSWSVEDRDYHVVIEMKQAGALGEQLRIARTALVVGNKVEDQPAVTVTWSDDARMTTRIDPQVAHYTDQAELADATREGFEALERGHTQEATVKLGRAMKLAQESGNEEATRRLAKIVDVVDANQGTVRLRASVQKADLLDAEVGAAHRPRRAPAKTPINTPANTPDSTTTDAKTA